MKVVTRRLLHLAVLRDISGSEEGRNIDSPDYEGKEGDRMLVQSAKEWRIICIELEA